MMPENPPPEQSQTTEQQPQLLPTANDQQNASVKKQGSLGTILLLIFLYPIGVLVMWFEKKWSRGVRVLLSIPLAFLVLLIILGPILLPFILIAANPAQRFVSQADDTKRRSDTSAILNAVGLYAAEHNALPTGISATPIEIAKTGADLCQALIPTYIVALPSDPKASGGANVTDCSSEYATGYEIAAGQYGNVTVSAPLSELSEKIQVSRLFSAKQ